MKLYPTTPKPPHPPYSMLGVEGSTSKNQMETPNFFCRFGFVRKKNILFQKFFSICNRWRCNRPKKVLSISSFWSIAAPSTANRKNFVDKIFFLTNPNLQKKTMGFHQFFQFQYSVRGRGCNFTKSNVNL